MNPQLNLFESFEAFRAAQKEVILFIVRRFSDIPFSEIEELVSESFLITHRFQEKGRLAIPPIAFARIVARRKATDITRKQAAFRHRGILMVEEDLATSLPTYTEGGDSEQTYDDDWQLLVNSTTDFIKKQSIEMQQIFDASYDSLLSALTDEELARHFNFKTQSATSVRKKRFDLKKKLKHYLVNTPQYHQVLRVIYPYRQVA